MNTHQSNIETWEGVVLKAKATDSITDKKHNEQYTRENNRRKLSAVLAISLLGLMVLPALQVTSWLYLSLIATSVAGAVTGYLLIAKDLGVTYKPIEKFCNAGKGTNCDRILNAEDANLFGFISFTDAAASYFFFQLLVVGLFIPFFESAATFLFILGAASMLNIPVIGYSIYYQAVKAKTWCRLCVSVDAILGLQSGFFALMFLEQMFVLTNVQLLPLFISALLFTAVTSSVLLLKNRLKTTAKSRKEVIASNRVKYDPGIFMRILKREEKVDTTSFLPEMIVGNREALVRIIMAANLHCNPCSMAFDTVNQILASYPKKCCFSFRFTRGMDNTVGELSASTYLIRYWQQFIHGRSNETDRTKSMLVDWYTQMNPELFAKKYPLRDGVVKIMGENSKEPEIQHYEWVKQNEIRRTPTFFINGSRMPQNYRVEDLMAMMPGLAAGWKNSGKISKDSAKEFA